MNKMLTFSFLLAFMIMEYASILVSRERGDVNVRFTNKKVLINFEVLLL